MVCNFIEGPPISAFPVFIHQYGHSFIYFSYNMKIHILSYARNQTRKHISNNLKQTLDKTTDKDKFLCIDRKRCFHISKKALDSKLSVQLLPQISQTVSSLTETCVMFLNNYTKPICSKTIDVVVDLGKPILKVHHIFHIGTTCFPHTSFVFRSFVFCYNCPQDTRYQQLSILNYFLRNKHMLRQVDIQHGTSQRYVPIVFEYVFLLYNQITTCIRIQYCNNELGICFI